MLEISPRWPESVCRHRPLEVSHTFVEWSKEPVMIRLPAVVVRVRVRVRVRGSSVAWVSEGLVKG